MDNRPIGFFDSGLGGLTCIPYLMRELPEEKIIYFGDTARTPYGSKATRTIRSFSMEIADFLVKSDVKMIVIACNTVSATCVYDLQKRFPQTPIIGIIEPTARYVGTYRGVKDKVGVIGTKVTITSHAYKDMIHRYNEKLNIVEAPCPAFVPLIEEGIIDNEIMDLTIKYYMDDFVYNNELDAIVLGCTHYPLIKKNIERLYPQLDIINPSDIVVGRIREVLDDRDGFASGSDFTNVFYASDLSENFINMIDNIFKDEEKKVKFLNFDLEREIRR